MKPKNAKQGNIFPKFSMDLRGSCQSSSGVQGRPRAGSEAQMDGITGCSLGFWAFLMGRGPGSVSRLVAMLVSHSPWQRHRSGGCSKEWCRTRARLAPSWALPCEHQLLLVLLRGLFSGLRVWRRTVDSKLSKEFSWNLNNMEHSVPLLQCPQPGRCVCPSHGWFSSKEYLLLFNNAVVYRHNLWINRKHTGCRPSKEMINRLCLAQKKKKKKKCFIYLRIMWE